MKLAKAIAVCVILAPASSMAEEIPPPAMMFIRGGVLCDTAEDLKIFLTKASQNGGNFVEDHGTTCGRFVPRTPIPMIVTPTEWYEMPDARVLLAHFFFAPQAWEQFGYVKVEPNPDYKPASHDIDA